MTSIPMDRGPKLTLSTVLGATEDTLPLGHDPFGRSARLEGGQDGLEEGDEIFEASLDLQQVA